MKYFARLRKQIFVTGLQMLLVGVLILSAALFGILTRPAGFLAEFWPANALLLGIMVRYRSLDKIPCWLAAFLGYVIADLSSGGSFFVTMWLTMGNLAGAITGVFLYRQLPDEDRNLHHPISVLYLFMICLVSATGAALVGAGIATVLFGRTWSTGFSFWMTTELVNYMLILPVILTAPPLNVLTSQMSSMVQTIREEPRFAGPVLALLISVMISLLVGGPGAIMFAVPALLWCSLTYRLFSTAFLTFLYCVWMMMAVSIGVLVIHPVEMDYIDATTSIRLGIALLALGPLTAASINATRNQLLASLDHAVNHDCLTDCLVRSAFMRMGSQQLEQDNAQGKNSAVLMMDIDHFKNINDLYGHTTGDQALVNFAKTVFAALRPGDLFGRLGGEEFAVVLSDVEPDQADQIAERLRSQVEESHLMLTDGSKLRMTVSIGISCQGDEDGAASLECMLSRADQALYAAKREGRNRVGRTPELPNDELGYARFAVESAN